MLKIQGFDAVTGHDSAVECELEDRANGKRKIIAVYTKGAHAFDVVDALIGKVVTMQEVPVACGETRCAVILDEDDYAVITEVTCMIEFTHEANARMKCERG